MTSKDSDYQYPDKTHISPGRLKQSDKSSGTRPGAQNVFSVLKLRENYGQTTWPILVWVILPTFLKCWSQYLLIVMRVHVYWQLHMKNILIKQLQLLFLMRMSEIARVLQENNYCVTQNRLYSGIVNVHRLWHIVHTLFGTAYTYKWWWNR